MKGFHYHVDNSTGEISRSVRIDTKDRELLAPMMEQQRQRFVERFGRQPGPDDPVFFDLDESKLKTAMADSMRAAGIRPALIYAAEKTGMIVTETNSNLIPDVDLEEWNAAVAEYYEQHPDEDPELD
jgi:hypothetical protein